MLRRVLFSVVLLVGLVAYAAGQSDSSVDPGKTAQAKSQEEFDKYLEIVTASEPQDVIGKANAFVAEFPQSELLSPSYQYLMHAFEQLNNFDGMLAAGQKALVGNPNNINILLALAPAMASRAAGRSNREELLTQAQAYAHHALEQMDSTRISRKLSMETWNQQKRQMQSEAHGVLGTVALQRKQLKTAVGEFETAISLAPQPQGLDYLRLGLANSANGARDNAAKNFRRAVELGPEAVTALAQEELKKLASRKALAR